MKKNKTNKIEQLGESVKIYLINSEKYTVIDTCYLGIVKDYTWRLDAKGYAVANYSVMTRHGYKQKCKFMHRLILDIKDRSIQVDHINRNRLDNRKSNLRICKNGENQMNAKKRSGCSSKFKGVSFHKQHEKWYSRISVMEGGKKIVKYLGYFDSETEAAKAYDSAALRYFKEFARTNEMLGLYNE